MRDERRPLPKPDDERIAFILDVWRKFSERVGHLMRSPTEPERERLAAYLTVAYFASGGAFGPPAEPGSIPTCETCGRLGWGEGNRCYSCGGKVSVHIPRPDKEPEQPGLLTTEEEDRENRTPPEDSS